MFQKASVLGIGALAEPGKPFGNHRGRKVGRVIDHRLAADTRKGLRRRGEIGAELRIEGVRPLEQESERAIGDILAQAALEQGRRMVVDRLGRAQNLLGRRFADPVTSAHDAIDGRDADPSGARDVGDGGAAAHLRISGP